MEDELFGVRYAVLEALSSGMPEEQIVAGLIEAGFDRKVAEEIVSNEQGEIR